MSCLVLSKEKLIMYGDLHINVDNYFVCGYWDL